MTTPAIRVENLGKRYKLGLTHAGTIRELVSQTTDRLLRCRPRHEQLGLSGGNGRPAAGSKTFWALKDVSFEVQPGEVLGIIGRNGAGKSTLLKILSRVTCPTTGRIELNGRVASLLEVGTGFHGELTGRENVYLNGTILGMTKPEIRRKFDEIVDFSGVEKFIDTPVKRYSSGMNVRLGFAVAAHLEPEILIVDEVLAVGDIGFQKRCLGKMHDVAGHGRTVLFVSHNMASVRSLCQRCICLCDGTIECDGNPEQVIDNYTAQFRNSRKSIDNGEIRGETGRGEDFVLYADPVDRHIEIDCGDRLSLCFEVAAPRSVQGASAGLLLLNRAGDPVVGMSSRVQMVESSDTRSMRWHVTLDCGRIPLNAGEYLVNVYFGDKNHNLAKFANAFRIVVHEYDVFGWGTHLPGQQSWGPLYWAPLWSFAPR